ncbi:kinase-associated lipoprotein B [Salipaludibacillus sp. LMS25]|jgi:kinase-associated protein B|uniref:kinase-associated lipoprotein B n=1 Tax=Salipaludibacillus sp. LMS25 TaxID=2924031 RepID=UPI0020D0B9E2|nr:kinase-associated lipoprotein B [Salipaludibacillus sp. LMS25]UTR15131.1 kinase-associated lipoprotein B [Salipaludibacillus sp. LMS25]
MESHLTEGDIATAIYKTGKYIGEIIGKNQKNTHVIVKILAVLTHPMQGDLHQPAKANVPLFHERKALSFNEKANIPLSHVKLYNGKIPDYSMSLLEALTLQKNELTKENSPWALKSLEALRKLEEETYKLNLTEDF